MIRLESEDFRSRAARESAERALVHVLQQYAGRPEFVVLGGLVPEFLCAESAFSHAGTTDIDVQVDLEIECGAVNTARLEQALHNAEFVPDDGQIWRWVYTGKSGATVVKFELLADLHDQPTEAKISFDQCKSLGALNLRGTGFASRDVDSEGHAHPRESIVVVQRTVCEEITGPVTTSPSCQVAPEAGPAGSIPAPGVLCRRSPAASTCCLTPSTVSR